MKNPDFDQIFGNLKKAVDKYPDKTPPTCRRCGKDMIPASMTGYDWKCACIPGLVLSRG